VPEPKQVKNRVYFDLVPLDRRLVDHLIGTNRVFAALLSDEPAPRPAANHIEDNPVGAYRDSAARLQAAIELPAREPVAVYAEVTIRPALTVIQLRSPARWLR
jgi:hypothetical protein